MKKIIHVNKGRIQRNIKRGITEPVLRVQIGSKKIIYGYKKVDILGPCSMVYSPDKPLKCGAKVWIETDAEILIDDKPMEEI